MRETSASNFYSLLQSTRSSLAKSPQGSRLLGGRMGRRLIGWRARRRIQRWQRDRRRRRLPCGDKRIVDHPVDIFNRQRPLQPLSVDEEGRGRVHTKIGACLDGGLNRGIVLLLDAGVQSSLAGLLLFAFVARYGIE